MKIAIVSDIHANYDAWQAFPEEYDELWVLGDLVNYGPQPAEVVREIAERADLIVRGNHDHAVAHDDDSKWSARFRMTAEATRRFSSAQLSQQEKAYLRALPLSADADRKGVRFHLTHARPSDRLYGRLASDAPEWADEIASVSADVLLVGHTHEQFMRRIGDKLLLNPGSLGQPRNGDGSLAQYAVWEAGAFALKSYRYRVDRTIEKIRGIGYDAAVEAELLRFLEPA